MPPSAARLGTSALPLAPTGPAIDRKHTGEALPLNLRASLGHPNVPIGISLDTSVYAMRPDVSATVVRYEPSPPRGHAPRSP